MDGEIIAMDYRIEHDSMGEVRVPADAQWRAQTQRAVENFPISGQRVEPALIAALARSRRGGRAVNAELGVLDRGRSPRRSRPRPTRSPRGSWDDALPDRRLPDRLRHVDAT